MGVVTAHAVAFIESLAGRLGRPCVLVAECDVVVDVVADRLDARPARRRLGKELPGDVRQAIRLAIAASQEIDDRLCRQVLDRVLGCRRGNDIGQA